jgi:arylsulfatase
MATAVDVAGLEMPAARNGVPVPPLEGRGLAPAFNGGTIDREALFWEHEGNRAVRQGRWKAVAVHGGAWELYDIEADRTELHDLAAPEPERLKDLVAMYDRWAERSSVLPWPAQLHAGR